MPRMAYCATDNATMLARVDSVKFYARSTRAQPLPGHIGFVGSGANKRVTIDVFESYRLCLNISVIVNYTTNISLGV